MNDSIREQFITKFRQCALITEKVNLIADPDLLSLITADAPFILDLCNKIVEEVEEKHFVFFDQNLEGNLYFTMARSYNMLSNLEDALREYTRAMYCFQNTKNLGMEARCLSGIGGVYEKTGDNATAYDYSYNALEKALKTGDRELEARLMNDLGYTHVVFGEYEKAMSYLLPSIQYLETSTNEMLLSFTKDSIAQAYLGLGQIDEALKNETEAIEIARNCGNWYGVASFLNFVGQIYHKQGKINQALDCIADSQKISEERGYETECATSYRFRGHIFQSTGDYDKAILNFKQAASIAKRIRANRVLFKIYREISDTARELKDFEQALRYFEHFHRLKEAAQKEQESQEKRYRNVINQAKVARREADLLQIKNDQLENEINERILLQQKLEVLAKTDSLTGLLNRRAFFTQAALAYERAIRQKQHFGVVLFDIDLFKQINDTYGHQIGDQVLSKVGRRLLRNAKEGDLVCRFGGEEFIILLQNSDLSAANQFAKDLRKLIKRPILAQDESYTITASFGVSHFDPAHPLNIDKLIEYADKATYRSKELGRDRVTLSEARNTRSLKLSGLGLNSIFTSKKKK